MAAARRTPPRHRQPHRRHLRTRGATSEHPKCQRYTRRSTARHKTANRSENDASTRRSKHRRPATMRTRYHNVYTMYFRLVRGRHATPTATWRATPPPLRASVSKPASRAPLLRSDVATRPTARPSPLPHQAQGHVYDKGDKGANPHTLNLGPLGPLQLADRKPRHYQHQTRNHIRFHATLAPFPTPRPLRVPALPPRSTSAPCLSLDLSIS
jgi:hypothetical protein